MVLHLHRANLSTLFPTASEDALQELRTGHQLGSSNRWGSRKRDWSGGMRHPNEWRAHSPWLRGGRGSPHEPEGHRSFQHAESAAQPPWTPQLQSGHGLHLLGTQQLYATWRERTGLQQPAAYEPSAAQTQGLYHLLAENAPVWWTIQERDWQRQVTGTLLCFTEPI